MKKTLIALAAVASLATSGAAFAQATISGGVGFASIKNLSGSSQGLLNTGAWLDVAASEDLGGGMKVSAFMELNMDSSRASAGSAYSGDRNMTLSTPSFSLTLANTRSGGAQAAALIAPVNLWDGYWGAGGVITRSNIDAAVLTIPMGGGLTVQGKYVESGPDYATSAGTTTMVLAAIYAAGPLKVAAGVNQSAFTPATAATLAAAGITNPRTMSTDLSVIYDAGVAKVGLGYDSTRRGKQDGTDDAAILAGVTVPMGKASFGVNYGKRGNGSFNQVGAQYDLSKRTNVNLSFGNADTGAANGQTNEYSLSLNHYF
jgi:hypothetical protein